MFCKFGNVEVVRFKGATVVRFRERADAEKAAAATNGVEVMRNAVRSIKRLVQINLPRIQSIPPFCRWATTC